MTEEHPGRWPVTKDGQVLYMYGKLHIGGYEIDANRLSLVREYILQLEEENERLKAREVELVAYACKSGLIYPQEVIAEFEESKKLCTL